MHRPRGEAWKCPVCGELMTSFNKAEDCIDAGHFASWPKYSDVVLNDD